jgi:hypothetical protein
MKDVVDGQAKHGNDLESHFQRRRVLAEFDRIDGLPGDPDGFGQLLLRHFPVFEP